jgi:hypothetical protein
VTGVARVPDDDDVLKARDAGEDRFEIGEVGLFHQDGAGLGVRQYPGPLPGIEPVVEQREHEPGRRHSVERLDVLWHVLRQDAHAVSRPA